MKSTAAVTTIAIDLAKEVFQLALADASNRGQRTDAFLLAARQMPRCSKYISP